MPDISSMLNELTSLPIWSSQAVRYALIFVPVVIGLLYCFYGYRLIRIISALIGASIGASVGLVVANYFKLDQTFTIVAIVVGAIIFGVLNYFIYRLGIFLSVFLAVFVAVVLTLGEFTKLDQPVIMIISLVSALIIAVLAVLYERAIVIIATSLGGAMMISDRVFDHLIQIRWDQNLEMYIRLGTVAVLALIGLIFQFINTKNMKPRESDYDDDEYAA